MRTPEGDYPYQQVARKIAATLGPAGSEVPSQRTLTLMYGVARETARRALGLLRTQGHIAYRDGRYIVRGRRRWQWNMMDWERMHGNGVDAWKASMLAQGAKTAESIIRVEHIATPPHVAEALRIPEGTEIVTRSRVHVIDGEPEQLSQSYYPPHVTDGFPAFTHPGDVSVPGGLLAASGNKQVQFSDLHTPRLPTEEESARLQMSLTELLLVILRTGFGADGQPVRALDLKLPSERSILSYGFAAE